jgi:hypothetical protein
MGLASAMLVAAISASSQAPFASGAIKRIKPTAQQVGLCRAERESDLQGAFKMPPQGKATRRRLRPLFRACAANVDAPVFARVVDPVRKSI